MKIKNYMSYIKLHQPANFITTCLKHIDQKYISYCNKCFQNLCSLCYKVHHCQNAFYETFEPVGLEKIKLSSEIIKKQLEEFIV